ncbi:cupin domain-containing protein [Sphingomonas crocodyli]|uniref:DUF861 domain-containing protein n=1 Tax=Sphingomonas crocodyli TaxID=1979270 RepID=A0A437M5Y7_9SPHN|nr:cupin domain-containing protein [Sphingomonas crocodyli]RVT92914.1 DUF861 domain-containing protein [Sphingomonas crocodyli]
MNSAKHEADSYPCIIDLRAFAAQSREDSQELEGHDFLADRRYVSLPDGPTALGLIELAAGTGTVASMPNDEFILVMDGEVQIRGIVAFSLKTGESAVLPKNAAFSWDTSAPATIAFMCQASNETTAREPVKIDPTLPREASPPLREGLVIGEMPKAFRHIDFESNDGLFAAAAWNANGYARRPVTFDYFELMHLLEGSVSFVDRRGADHVFSKDDIFVVRKGGEVNWVSTVPVSKVAAICRA